MVLTRRMIPAAVAAAGLDTDSDPKIVSQGLIRVQNASYRRQGAVCKVFGHDYTSAAFTEDDYMASYKDRAIVWGKNLHVWNGTEFEDTADDIRVLDAEIERVEALGNTVVLQQSMAESGSVRAVAWIGSDDDGIQHYVATYELDTGLLIQRYEIPNAYSLSMLHVVYTTTALLYFYVDTDGNLRRGTINEATGAVAAATVIDPSWPTVAATPLSKDFDFAYIDGTSDYVALAYVSDDGSHSGDAIYATVTGAGTAEGYAAATLSDCQVAGVFKYCSGVGAFTYVDAYSGGTEFYMGVQLRDEDTSSIMNELVLKYWTDTNLVAQWPLTGVAHGDYDGATAGVASVYFNWNDSNYSYPEWEEQIRRVRFAFDGASTGTITSADAPWLQGVSMALKPWTTDDSGDQRHVMAVCPYIATPGDQDQFTYYVVSEIIENSAKEFVCKFLPGEAFPLAASWSFETSWEGRTVRRAALGSYHSGDTQGIFVVDLVEDFGAEAMIAVETLDHLVFPSSVSRVWDGQVFAEQGFLLYPHRIDVEQAAGAGLDAPSTYGYVATYEWYDPRGNRWQSAPSPVASVITNTGFAQVTVHVPPLVLTQKSNVQVVLWRTDGYGSVYRRVDSVANDTEAAYVAFTDSLSDSSLADNELLYTQPPGDVLEDVAPPPTKVAAIHQNRLFVVNREKPSTEIQYSKEFQHRHGVRHSDFLTIEVSSQGGEILALRSFLDRLIIFKRHSIWYCYGNGLSATGTGSGYTEPSLLHPSLGVENQKAILETPHGLMFLATDGRIWLLDRSMKMSPIGDGVAHFTKAADLDVRTALAVPEQDEAVFLSTDGYGMTFNWKYALWSLWSGYQAYDGCLAKPRPEAGIHQVGGSPVLWWKTASASDKVARQVPGQFTRTIDGSPLLAAPSTIVETGWFPFAGIEGFQRVKRLILLGQMPTDCRIQVKIAYDYDTNWTDTLEFDGGSNLLAEGVEQFFDIRSSLDTDETDQACAIEVSGSRQKCSAIRLQIRDLGITATNSNFTVSGAGFELSAITFEVAVKEGPGLRSETRRTPAD